MSFFLVIAWVTVTEQVFLDVLLEKLRLFWNDFMIFLKAWKLVCDKMKNLDILKFNLHVKGFP